MSAVTKSAEVTQTAHPVGQSHPTLADMNRVVAAVMQAMYPTIRNVRVVGDIAGPDGAVTLCRLPVPIDGPTSDLKDSILRTLSKMKPGEWMKGRNVAWDIDENLDHKSGSFTRAMRELKDEGKIESHKANGYRLNATE